MRLIDADELNRHIFEEVPLKHFGDIKTMGFVRDLIDNAPTVDGVKHGEWYAVDKWEHIFKCSVCGRIGRIPQQDGGYFGTNFCPNCGADMRGEEDETNRCRCTYRSIK